VEEDTIVVLAAEAVAQEAEEGALPIMPAPFRIFLMHLLTNRISSLDTALL